MDALKKVINRVANSQQYERGKHSRTYHSRGPRRRRDLQRSPHPWRSGACSWAGGRLTGAPFARSHPSPRLHYKITTPIEYSNSLQLKEFGGNLFFAVQCTMLRQSIPNHELFCLNICKNCFVTDKLKKL